MSEANTDRNERVGWVDIPVADVERAAGFYREVLDIAVAVESFGEHKVGVLAHGPGNGGCLVKPMDPDWVPSRSGVLIYLGVEGRIRDAVAKVQAHGGEVLEDVNPIGPHGFRAVVVDSEGNRVALHSNVDA
jgi:predicted enzyme related to lactoylglutathione lyase